MFKHHFYHSTIRKYTTVFGSLFNDITLIRTDSAGNEVQRIKVPLAYSPKNFFINRLAAQPELEKPAAITLPRMGFYNSGLQYDGQRTLDKRRKNRVVDAQDNTVLNRQFVPVPYNLMFELYVFVKNYEDGAQIVEQILPYFQPNFNVTINTVPEMGLKDDAILTLNSVSPDHVYEGNYETRRAFVWTLSFTFKAWFYGPVSEQGLIRKVQTDLLVAPNTPGEVTSAEVANTPRSARITTEPDPLTADIDDDYGFSQTFEEFDDNKKFNPVTGQDEDV